MFSFSSIAALEEDVESPAFLAKVKLAHLMGQFWELSRKKDKVVVTLRDYKGYVKQREKQKARLIQALNKIPSAFKEIKNEIQRDLEEFEDEMNENELKKYLEYLDGKIKPLEKEINGLQRLGD